MDIIFHLSQTNVVIAAITTVVCLVSLLIINDSRNKQRYWADRGIKGPPPVPLFGNLFQILFSNRMGLELEWVKKYGKVYGIYQGNTPHLVVADPDIMIQVCVKDFEYFQNHGHLEFANKYMNGSLFNQTNEYWKRARTIMSPTFTSGKIRRMFRFLDGCSNDLVQCFDEELKKRATTDSGGAVVNVKDQFQLYAMDSIATCCYGLKLERATSASAKSAATKEAFAGMAMKVFQLRIFRLLFMFSTPKPLLRLIGFRMTPDGDINPLADKLKALIDQRRAAPKKFDDYLQLLIDARLDAEYELDEMDSAENHHINQTRESLIVEQKRMVDEIWRTESGSSKASLTDFEVLSNATTLMVVGLETTATLLTHCTYVLAFHQEIQERLYEEIVKIGEFDESKQAIRFDYEPISSCRYLDAVLAETLRLLSPVIQIDRWSNKSYHMEKYNLDLPEKSKLYLAHYALHNSPDYWTQPELFKPERFFPENKEKIVPGSYIPFGIGPRHCLGMRFSLAESKIALAKLVVNFRFEPAPNTKFPPEPKRLFGLLNITTPTVTIKSRRKEQ